MTATLAIVGDFNAASPSHLATNNAIEHARNAGGLPVAYEWVETTRLGDELNEITHSFDGFWIAPGSPYNNMEGVLEVIRYARANQLPLLGTCGGFQHMVIEYARNVAGIADAQHAEYDPYASRLVVSPLSCSLYGQVLEIRVTEADSRAYRALATDTLTEQYYCNFGLNPEYEQQLHDNGFRIVARDANGEARIMEITDHPFFIGTLFVPQHHSSETNPHPLITAFLKSVVRRLSSVPNAEECDATAAK